MARRAAWVAAAAIVVMAGCRTDTVALGFDPAVGAVFRYRYEVDATITTVVEGGAPEVTEVTSTVTSEQEVVERTAAGLVVEVRLRADEGVPRTAVVLLDRAGSLGAIQQVDGLSVDLVGLPSAGALLASTATEPPSGPLRLGDRWPIEDGLLRGSGRLDRLGVVDGRDVAVVASRLDEQIEDTTTVDDSLVTLAGLLRSTTSTAFDLADGAIRRARTRSEGTVDALISPPPNVDAPPVAATITYELRVRTTRLG